MAGFIRLLKDTSPWGYVLVLVFLAGLAAIILYWVSASKRAQAKTWLLAAAPLALVVIAAIGYAHLSFRVARAIAGNDVDRLAKIRISAEGASEALKAVLLGCAFGAVLLALGAFAAAAIALRHVWRARWGAAIGAAIAGVFLAFVMAVVRAKVIAKMGMLVWSDRWLPAAIAPALMCAVIALLAGAAVAGEGGGQVGHPDEPARDRELGGEALAIVAAALGAVVLTLVASQLSSWEIIFGANSGESVDAEQRLRIFDEGANEARALVVGGVLMMFGPVVAFAVAYGPRARVIAQGVRRGSAAAGLALATMICAMLATTITTSTARSRIDALGKIDWPKDVRPVAVGTGRPIWDPGTPTFVRRDADCTAVVSALKLVPTNQLPTWLPKAQRSILATFAVDKDTPAATVHCLAARAADARGPSDMGERFVELVVREDFALFLYKGGEKKEYVETMDSALLVGVARAAVLDETHGHLHVTRTGWQLRVDARTPTTRGEGEVVKYPAKLTTRPPSGTYANSAAKAAPTFTVSADPDVTAERLFRVIGATEVYAGFDLAPPGSEKVLDQSAPSSTGSYVIKRISGSGLSEVEEERAHAALERALPRCMVRPPPEAPRTFPLDVSVDVAKGGTTSVRTSWNVDPRASCIAAPVEGIRYAAGRKVRTVSFRITDGT
jgi:hypothetical protein